MSKPLTSIDLNLQVSRYRAISNFLTAWMLANSDQHQSPKFYKVRKLRDRCFARAQQTAWVIIYRAGVEPKPWHND